MPTQIDHLRVDHRITVLRDFTDLNGQTMCAGESGVLRQVRWDQVRDEEHLEIERTTDRVNLVFSCRAKTGPRNGRMREYFEVGEDMTPPRISPAFHDHSLRKMIVPPPDTKPIPRDTSPWAKVANSTDGPDRLEEMEAEIRRSYDHIGVAASIAEIYASRMRAFQRAGNETRAIAAFKLAVDWMASYAGSATSGGEGAALSHEYDRFREALASEFGYDPLDNE